MPVLKHAKKKLRQDKKRTARNKSVKSLYKSVMKKAQENPSEKTIGTAFKQIDKAVKHNILHDNKGARLKSSLSKLLKGEKKAAQPALAKNHPSSGRKVTKPKRAPAKTKASSVSASK